MSRCHKKELFTSNHWTKSTTWANRSLADKSKNPIHWNRNPAVQRSKIPTPPTTSEPHTSTHTATLPLSVLPNRNPAQLNKSPTTFTTKAQTSMLILSLLSSTPSNRTTVPSSSPP